MPLKSSAPVIRSPRVVAKLEPRPYVDFDDFTRIADKIVEHSERTAEMLRKLDLIEAKWIVAEWPAVAKLLAKYRQADAFYDRPALYDKAKDKWTISREFVAEQVALLVGSCPNGKPHNPETYTMMMVEEIIAARPDPDRDLLNAVVLEAACRKIRRRPEPFLPAIGEMLKALTDEAERWSDRWDAVERIEGQHAMLEAAIAEARDA
jgi:hypothetical protein